MASIPPTLRRQLGCSARAIGVPNPAGNPAVGGFGTALVAVPQTRTGMAWPSLVVGAPPDRAYLLFSPFDGSTPPKMFTKVLVETSRGITISTPIPPTALRSSDNGWLWSTSTATGQGTRRHRLAGRRRQHARGRPGADLQALRLPLPTARQPIAVVNDSNPIANTDFFGIGLADLEFNSSRACANKGEDAHLLVVGDDAGHLHVLPLCRFADPKKSIGADPRCFAQKVGLHPTAIARGGYQQARQPCNESGMAAHGPRPGETGDPSRGGPFAVQDVDLLQRLDMLAGEGNRNHDHGSVARGSQGIECRFRGGRQPALPAHAALKGELRPTLQTPAAG